MLGNELLELRHELRVAAEPEIGLDPLLDCGEAQLLQAKPLAPGERVAFELGERRALPQLEGLPETAGGCSWFEAPRRATSS